MKFWWTKEKPAEPPVLLKPGKCECGHRRCSHVKGVGHCCTGFPPKSTPNPTGEWAECSCQIYVPKHDDNDDADAPEPPVPHLTSAELEKMLGMGK
jgi:hypothetical protein